MKEGAKLTKLLDKINTNVSQLYHIATHDEKTGLHNHVFFKEVFGFELDKARRGRPLSLIIIDIDFFKKVNDTYGHIQADKILKRLAKVLEESVREYDVVARFGGEEFFVMLPNTVLFKAGKIAGRIRRAVLNDAVLKKYNVTISLGVSAFRERDNFERISKRADKALYRAKKEGRNRVVVN
jgi:diguanylate cyclase (GGDEF)-like protein